jgi:tRNA pseudouridine13 synthase
VLSPINTGPPGSPGPSGTPAPPGNPAITPPRDPIGTVPFVTADVPGIGGRLKERIEDFAVEEVPAYLPCGEGEHVYLFVEKRGLTTSQLVHAISKHFGVPRNAIGYAGMKDKNAVTRQLISIHTPGRTFRDFPDLMNDRIVVLNADMHTNKLRLGHLRGNRFSIKIRGVRMTEVVKAHRVLKAIEQHGAANYVGEQRFGALLNNHLLGRAALKQDWRGALDVMLGPDPMFPNHNPEARSLYAQSEFTRSLDAFPNACRHERIALHALERGDNHKRAVLSIDIDQRRFWFSALQSAIFNRVLARRVEAASWHTLIAGDIAMKRENGAAFPVDDAVIADPATPGRLASLDISPSGPIWGTKMMRASGPVDEMERSALAEFCIEIQDLAQAVTYLGDSMIGARRAMRIPVEAAEVEGGIDEHGDFVRVGFTLPAGAYATIVLREIMKSPIASFEDRED